MSIAYKTCKNCENSFRESYRHCPECGYDSNTELNIKTLFSNTIGNYLSVDARLFKSLIPLFFKPGFLAKEYIKGKRLKYLAPPQFYLFSTILFFFLFSFEVNHQAESLDKSINDGFVSLNKPATANDSLKVQKLDSILTGIKNDVSKSMEQKTDTLKQDIVIKKNDVSNFQLKLLGLTFKSGMIREIDSLITINAPDTAIYKVLGLKKESDYLTRRSAKQFVKFYKRLDGGSVLKLFISYIPLALFFLLPFFAFILKLLFFKNGTYVKHLIFTLYFFAFIFLVLSIMVLGSYCQMPYFVQNILAISLFVYMVIAIKQFYNSNWFLSILKGMIIFVFYTLAVLVVITNLFLLAFYMY